MHLRASACLCVTRFSANIALLTSSNTPNRSSVFACFEKLRETAFCVLADNLTLCCILSQRNITIAVFPHFWSTYFLCIPLLHLRLIFIYYAVFITPGVFADLIKFLRALLLLKNVALIYAGHVVALIRDIFVYY